MYDFINQPVVSAVLGIIFGVLISGPITYYFTKKLLPLQEFYREASVFRDAFVKEQRLLTIGSFIEKPNNLTAQDIVANAINRHEIAMLRFKPFVPIDQYDNYEKAWNDYTGNNRRFEQYAGHEFSGKDKLALGHIEKLLEFAKHKH